MKLLVGILLVLFPAIVFSEAGIQNLFAVDHTESVFRGREPGKNMSQLQELNITDVIIFKNDVKGEVQKELSDLAAANIKGHHIPFYWKAIPSMQMACEQIIEAIQLIEKVRKQHKNVYFHCTVGEDRTGLLAGLFKMLDQGLSAQTVFAEEMCAKGYGDGNIKKPRSVTSLIEQGLTPLFLSMSAMIERGEISLGNLDKKICRNIKINKQTKRCR